MFKFYDEYDVPLVASLNQLSFHHQAEQVIGSEIKNAYQAYCMMTNTSSFMLKLAMWMRDKVSRLGGIKPIVGFARKSSSVPQVGNKLDFFDVCFIGTDLLVLTANDTHLDVMVAIQLKSQDLTNSQILRLVTSVKTHNLFGKLYMLPVAPAHSIIVRNMLNQVALKRD